MRFHHHLWLHCNWIKFFTCPMQSGGVAREIALSTRTTMTGVGSLHIILYSLDLLFIEVEKVVFYESFLEGN